MASSVIQLVPFNGQTLSAVKAADGWKVSLKRLCENIGVAYNAQYERLQRQPWAVIRITRTTGADGKNYEMAMIDRQTLIMWLATIDINRIKNQQAKQTLITYQKECASALDHYFTQGGAIRTLPGDTDSDIMARAILIAQKTIEQRTQQLQAAQNKIEADKPKVLFADAVSASDGTCLVGELAKMITQSYKDHNSSFTIGQNRLFARLREDGYLGTTGQNKNVPLQRYIEQELFRIKETAITHPDGHVSLNRTPKVTGRGQRYFLHKYGWKETTKEEQ